MQITLITTQAVPKHQKILFLVKRGFSYSDIISMPVHIRRYFIEYLLEIEGK